MRFHPAADAYPMLSDERLQQLADDIRANGLIEPITLIGQEVLDGRNRLRACELAGVQPEFEQYTGDSPYSFVASKNSQRRDLTQIDRDIATATLANEIAAEVERARRRKQAETQARLAEEARLKAPPPLCPPIGGDSPPEQEEQEPAPAREPDAKPKPKPKPTAMGEAAKATGGSARGGEKVAYIEKNAPELHALMVAFRRMSTDAYHLLAHEPEACRAFVVEKLGLDKPGPEIKNGPRAYIKQWKRSQTAAQIAAMPAPVAEGTFRTIVADPPWEYEKRVGDATHRGDLPYPSMKTEDICDLASMVQERAHEEGAVLWLWTTNAFLRDAYRVLDAWGFEERTVLTWVKDRWGLGDWLRGQSEHCILAVRGMKGTPPWWGGEGQAIPSTVLHGPLREHSRKPDEFYALVDALCPGAKFELFSRTPRPGWVQWGAETEKFDAA